MVSITFQIYIAREAEDAEEEEVAKISNWKTNSHSLRSQCWVSMVYCLSYALVQYALVQVIVTKACFTIQQQHVRVVALMCVRVIACVRVCVRRALHRAPLTDLYTYKCVCAVRVCVMCDVFSARMWRASRWNFYDLRLGDRAELWYALANRALNMNVPYMRQANKRASERPNILLCTLCDCAYKRMYVRVCCVCILFAHSSVIYT